MRYLGFAVFMCVAAQSGFAQNATPSHVFQTTETVRLQLAAYNAANFTAATDTVQTPQNILPRHVLHFAERVQEKVQLLRYMNGLPTASATPQPVKDVKPSDVNALVKQIEAQVSELASAYGVDLVETTALPSNKKPADVYANLLRLSVSLDTLGVPATVPNDVYRIARSVKLALGELARQAGVDLPEAAIAIEAGRTPADVYDAGLALIEDLTVIAGAGGQFAVNGGVTSPGARSANINPTDVSRLLLRILADVDAMKYSSGLRTVSSRPPLEGGKTPTDVWRVLMEARAITNALRAL